jgi:thiol:disulfide interchange protein
VERHLAILGLCVAAAASIASAQKLNPVQWSLAVEPATAAAGSSVLGRVTAKLEPGWHLYALAVPQPIIATTIRLAENPAVESVRVYQPPARTALDENFGFEVASYQGETTFLLEIKLAAKAAPGPVELTAETRFQSCNNKMCLPPRRATAMAPLTVDPKAAVVVPVIPAGYTLFDPAAPPPRASKAAVPPAPAPPAAVQGGAMFLLVAFGFGLAAIFTPCVFPMIPITVSYFLKRPEGGSRGAWDALLFCLGIVVLFTGLGLAVTAILGPFGVVQLGSNVWVNAFIAAVFLVFALSLLGAFEITIPSGVLTRLDRASQGGGIAGTLLMGLTFSLTAFACVGPFVGTLLAASVSGGGLRPLFGMVAFASGLATPFFFLALFPSYLKRMPKSGGWLERVKVVMGLLVLAAMFKYLSSVDQVMQWNVLTRERFLAAWIVLFALAGLYLLGLVRLAGVKAEEAVGVGRLLVGAVLVMFAISLAPGMFGGRLGELDAYVPAPSGGTTAAASGERVVWAKNQYREALELARRENKPVLVAFTGYACTNCHWMKANLFPRPEIAAALQNFVLVELYTDGTDAASARNQALENTKFSSVAIPYYAILDADERVLAAFPGLTRDAGEFLRFLRSAERAPAAS